MFPRKAKINAKSIKSNQKRVKVSPRPQLKNNALRRRLYTSPRSPEFKKLDRRLLMTMPSSKENQEAFYNDTIVAEGMHSRTGICAQVNSRFNDKRGFFEFGLIKPDELNAFEQGQDWLERTWVPPNRVVEALFFDHEPRYEDENGRWHHWSGRSVYTPEDIMFIQLANKELSQFRLPVSQYGIPRVPKNRRMNFFEMRERAQSTPMLEGCDYVQLNHYPYANIASYDAIDQNEAGIRESIQQSAEVYSKIFPDKPIVPIVWTHYSQSIATERFFSIIMSEYSQIDAIKTIIYWTNPHIPVMARIYGDRFRTVAPHLRAWLMG